MRSFFVLLFVVSAAGCATAGAQEMPRYGDSSATGGGTGGGPSGGLLVRPDTKLTRHAVVVAVLDFHTAAESQDKGFEELRARATALGADEVIGAEFEHGEKGEPSHLSGMAIKYQPDDTRAYKVIGNIDIATPEDADDKGFDKMRSRGRELGADKIVDVVFKHGEEGGMSHLTGVAVKHVDK